jgi:8-oxo-dGTP diphosphatase
MSPLETDMIRAAGGILVRRTRQGPLEVALVHRPGREDWSYPKGKVEPGETFEDCARREVLEETGFRCRLGRFVGHTEYRDRKDRPKIVAYWLMAPESGFFYPNDEVDELRWLGVDEARGLLSYERDRDLLAVLSSSGDVTGIVA